MVGFALGLLMLLLHAQAQEECINPLAAGGECPTVTPTETVIPEPTETPTLEPTATSRPTPEPTDTPTQRATPTLRPTPELPERPTVTPRPTRLPGPERARSPECLAAPPPVSDLPGIRERDWTPAERCGGTPEAQATRYVVERLPPPEPSPPAPERSLPPLVVVIVNVIRPEPEQAPGPTFEPTERMPIEGPHVPIQMPEESGGSTPLD